MSFQRYEGFLPWSSRLPQPHKMKVTQTVVRRNLSRSTLWRLERSMRKGMAMGMQFSIETTGIGDVFAIRRDK